MNVNSTRHKTYLGLMEDDRFDSEVKDAIDNALAPRLQQTAKSANLSSEADYPRYGSWPNPASVHFNLSSVRLTFDPPRPACHQGSRGFAERGRVRLTIQ